MVSACWCVVSASVRFAWIDDMLIPQFTNSVAAFCGFTGAKCSHSRTPTTLGTPPAGRSPAGLEWQIAIATLPRSVARWLVAQANRNWSTLYSPAHSFSGCQHDHSASFVGIISTGVALAPNARAVFAGGVGPKTLVLCPPKLSAASHASRTSTRRLALQSSS